LRWLCDGTDRLNWRDLHVIIVEAGIDSPIISATTPDIAGWDKRTSLLADIFDALMAANWQRGAGKSWEKPDPYPRPKPPEEPETLNPSIEQSGRYIGEPAPLNDVAEWLGWDSLILA